MRISYDERSRGLLISFGDPSRYRVSREIADGVVVDFDEDGKALAVELEDVAAVVDPREVSTLVRPRIKKGSDLRTFRDRLGLTQEQLSELIEIPRNTIARWEREELPIAKVRQLELALGAILRPEVDRSFKIAFSDNEGEGFLECGFCGERYALPFGMELHGGAPSQEPDQIIREHHDPDFDDDTEKIPRCPSWHRWKSAPWELRNTDDGAVISRGTIRASKNGNVTVETAFRASLDHSLRRSS
jgi:transcriptional regulator with XRE-family HTH domain/uncharacterized protein YuzE